MIRPVAPDHNLQEWEIDLKEIQIPVEGRILESPMVLKQNGASSAIDTKFMHLPIVETKKLDKWIFAYANKDFPIADEIYTHII